MATTIAVSGQTRKKLMQIKLDEHFKNIDELIEKMVIEHKLTRLTNASKLFQERMKQYDLELSELIQ